ncbi:YceI family protein [Hymenobacter gummosus]|nr:YceI family protein [Hymenobacter gummosus]
MKILLIMLLATAALAFRPATTAYTARPADSRLSWTGHAEVGSYAPTGTVALRNGRFEYDGTRLRGGHFVVDLTALRHDNAQLQEHLRGADFFDVARFPTAELRLLPSPAGQARGQLTIRGVAQPVSFPVRISRLPGGQLRVQGTATLDRTRFGIRYNSASFFAGLGDQAIRNDFQLTFDVLAAADASVVKK